MMSNGSADGSHHHHPIPHDYIIPNTGGGGDDAGGMSLDGIPISHHRIARELLQDMAVEELALLSLVQSSYDEEEGSDWSAELHGWTEDSGIHVCDWDGVACRPAEGQADVQQGSDQAGSDQAENGSLKQVVAELNLPFEGLSGTIPTELGLLKDLEVVTLRNNVLRGSIPDELAALPKLRSLDLTQCFLTGALPQRWASSQLATLNLANNAISGRFFKDGSSPHLSSLKQVRMENNLLTGTLHGPTISSMPNIQTLSLSDNDLSGLIPGDALGSRQGLHHLYLDANHFLGPLPSGLARGGAQILELWVQDNALSGTVPASFARFDTLHDFYVDGNKLTGALPPAICGPQVNADFFENVPLEAERNYCDSIACPAGSVALEGMYPCTECPGGEGARLKNRYIGQQGKCVDGSQRDILRQFREATTKGGAWNGIDDWADPSRPVCDMTGVSCDSHGNIVKIHLKNRGLQGHIPDVVGLLTFLEVLDLSDNALMGYLPSDLRWTSLTTLDVSGNKLRGTIPPLLCKMEELNGNGDTNGFHCDRLACPAGTYNVAGRGRPGSGGDGGEACLPCGDDSPYIAQKTCKSVAEEMPQEHLEGQLQGGSQDQPETFVLPKDPAVMPKQPVPKKPAREVPQSAWKDIGQVTGDVGGKSEGVSLQIGLGIFGIIVGTCVIAAVMCWAVRCVRPRQEKMRERDGMEEALNRNYNVDDAEDHEDEDYEGYSEGSSYSQDEDSSRYRDQPRRLPRRRSDARREEGSHIYEEDHPEAVGNSDDYSFRDVHERDPAQYRTPTYRDDHPDDDLYGEDDAEGDDDLGVSWSRRSAADFIREHQGIALNRRERFQRSMSEQLSPDIGRRAREAASNINVGARRRMHSAKVKRLAS